MKSLHETAIVSVVFTGLLLSSSTVLLARGPQQQEPTPAADNTKINVRDQQDKMSTADQQKENRSDRELTRQIRRSLMKDGSLSTYAHNVKIVAQNGMVTLRGPVRSDEEKKAVEAKASEVAGENKVTSMLEVAPKK